MGQNNDNHPYHKKTKHSIALDPTCHYLIDVLSPNLIHFCLYLKQKAVSLQGTVPMPQVVGPHWWQKQFPFWGKWTRVIQIFTLVTAAAAGMKCSINCTQSMQHFIDTALHCIICFSRWYGRESLWF